MFGHSEFNMKYRKDYYCSTEFFYFNQIYTKVFKYYLSIA
jgi:hypothetical protein